MRISLEQPEYLSNTHHQQRSRDMNSFLRTLLIGVGIGLLIAPMPGRDMRQLLRSRLQQFFGSAPENAEMETYEISQDRPSATKSALKQTAEASMNTPSEGTLAAEAPTSYTPAYPEYVNPERKSNQ
jgi:gas vesicle protein